LLSVARGELSALDDRSLRPSGRTSVCVVAAAQGYPEAPRTGDRIEGLDAEELCDAVYCAGVARQGSSLVTAGGRVLSLVGTATDVAVARERAYAGLQGLRFDGLYVRRDIGLDP
jgi:phosphoribosylamine--glycine ligase